MLSECSQINRTVDRKAFLVQEKKHLQSPSCVPSVVLCSGDFWPSPPRLEMHSVVRGDSPMIRAEQSAMEACSLCSGHFFFTKACACTFESQELEFSKYLQNVSFMVKNNKTTVLCFLSCQGIKA